MTKPLRVWVDEVTGACYRFTGERLTSLVLEGVKDGD